MTRGMEALLTLNAGSSSIKFALFRRIDPVPARPELVGQIDGIGTTPHLRAKDAQNRILDDGDLPIDGAREGGQHGAALAHLVKWLDNHDGGSRIVAVGHRVVHGGEDYAQPIWLDDTHLARLKEFVPLAPLHQPHNLAGIEAMRAALPAVPQIACFDTAFHRTQPAIAQLFALPRRITAQGVRRYGFHGLSYEYIADVLPQHLDEQRANGRVIVAHLVNLPFYWLAVKRMGGAFTLKTLATVAIVALLSEALPHVVTIAAIDPFFAALAGGLLMGVGMLILFRHRASLGGLNVLVLWLQERSGWRAGKLQMGLDVVILLGAAFVVPPLLLAASILGAVLLNFALAVNHKPGRYMAF